ncbi:hypothetical protein SETIT_9G091500v2 [Setaria italica]|uniref:Uncharacterized protein n=1 Tax=Setaria italica TaxID=4555 RepID=A0A368SEN5_SETIT|nr:hypothetical protein SETIT_9G091500v2 [Setaria italica]
MNLTLAQAQQAGAGETTTRKKKVIKKRLPQELIKYMIATPHPIIGEPLTDDQFTKHSKGFREAYTKSKVKSERSGPTTRPSSTSTMPRVTRRTKGRSLTMRRRRWRTRAEAAIGGNGRCPAFLSL